MKKKITDIIVVILSILFGILLGKLLDWSCFELTYEFSIIDALSLVITVAVAIYITKVLEKEVADSRLKKDLFVIEITELESILRSIIVLFEERDISVNKVAVRVVTCHDRSSTLFQHIRNILIRNNSPYVDNITRLIDSQMFVLNQLLTEPETAYTDQTGFTLRDDIVCYTAERTKEIRKAINDVIGNLFELKVWVNNL
jgi:hypothetical protein